MSDVLRDARQLRGESLEEVAGVTGIRQRYLENLEEGGASFDPFPGRVYGRFFLREYAEHLGLDPRPLVDAFDGEAGDDGAVEPLDSAVRTPRSWRATPLVALVCVVALLVASAILRGNDRNPPMTGTSVAAAFSRLDLQPHRAPVVPSERVEGIGAIVTVAGRCWIEAVVDGETVHQATAQEGTVLEFEANRRLELTLGNPGGVDLDVNGRPWRIEATGEALRLAFVLKDGRLTSVES
jgi:cytoskeleton protein RodZ